MSFDLDPHSVSCQILSSRLEAIKDLIPNVERYMAAE
jgi:hypothetical protein